MLLTSCGAKEKYPPQKQDFGGDYTWHYYNDRGQCIRYESFRDEVLTEIHHFEYDADGNVIKKQTTDPDGTAQWMQEYGEDESGRFTTRTSYFDENEEVMKIVLKTSTNNGYKEEILYDRDAQ